MQHRKQWDRRAPKAVAAEAAMAAAIRPFSIATRRNDERVKALGDQGTLFRARKAECPQRPR